MTEFRKLIRVHWKASGLILVVVFASISSAYAYWKINMLSASLPATSMFTSYPLELRMELDKTEFQQAELIRVYAFLKNVSNRTVELEAGGPILDFNITDASGTVVYQWSRNYLWILFNRKVLKTDEEFNSAQKSEVYDEIANPPIGAMVPLQLPKGTYQLIESSHPLDVEYVDPLESIGEFVLETPPITIKII